MGNRRRKQDIHLIFNMIFINFTYSFHIQIIVTPFNICMGIISASVYLI